MKFYLSIWIFIVYLFVEKDSVLISRALKRIASNSGLLENKKKDDEGCLK